MRPAEDPRRRPGVRQAAAAVLIAYGVLGAAVQLRLLSLLYAGISGWLGTPIPEQTQLPTWPGPILGHFDGLPWLPWAAWLIGTALLFATPQSKSAANREPDPQADMHQARWIAVAVVAGLLLLGTYTRMVQLWPQSAAISQLPYDDEGVYAGTSQLFLQGIMPYRDYFFAHPPVAAFSYAPAMAYHFTEWGSPTSFVLARYLSVAYSLLTLVLIFLIGRKVAGIWGGAAAGLLWALDGRVVEINRKIMLDGPMVLLSCAALLLYLQARPSLSDESRGREEQRPLFWLGLAGVCGALSALTKIAGIACLAAIAVDMLWLSIESRRRAEPQRTGLLTQYVALAGGALAAAVVVLVPFLALAGEQFARQVLFFQLLRPGDGLIDVPARIADLSATNANPVTAVATALGFAVLSIWVWMRGTTGPWRAVVLWTFFSLVLFTYSRSFYQHYYIQLAAPLCLLGAGVSLLFGRSTAEREGRPTRTLLLKSAPAVLVAVAVLPLIAAQWGVVTGRREDRLFEIVGRYVSDAVPPGAQVLTTDEQFNFLAARPPSRNATGYLIDSYGHMIYLGLGLDGRTWGDLWGSAFGGSKSNDAYAIMQRAAPQRDILDRASRVPLIVVHDRGYSRLTPETVDQIEAQTSINEEQARYTIYRSSSPQR